MKVDGNSGINDYNHDNYNPIINNYIIETVFIVNNPVHFLEFENKRDITFGSNESCHEIYCKPKTVEETDVKKHEMYDIIKMS